MLHLISLNKYVVTLIINQGNSCLTYFMIVSLCLFSCPFIWVGQIIPLLEKILLLVRYNCFVVSSIIRLKNVHSIRFKGDRYFYSFSLFWANSGWFVIYAQTAWKPIIIGFGQFRLILWTNPAQNIGGFSIARYLPYCLENFGNSLGIG